MTQDERKALERDSSHGRNCTGRLGNRDAFIGGFCGGVVGVLATVAWSWVLQLWAYNRDRGETERNS